MGLQTNQCCCCPACSVETICCKCVCRRICVIFTPTNALDSDYNICPELSVNMDWDEAEQDWHGSLAGQDLKYFFYKDDTGCYFKLRSSSLGYPEGYELVWPVGDLEGYVSCSNPMTEVGVPGDECEAGIIRTSCAPMYVPHNCTGCGCACECLCVTYTKGSCVVGGKACNDGLGNWVVTLHCDLYGPPVTLTFSMFPRSATCDPDTDPYCDPIDKTCVLLMSFGSDTQEPTEVSCPEIGGTWTIEEYGEQTVTITARCAVCTEDCERNTPICCEGYALPNIIYATLDIYVHLECVDAYGNYQVYHDGLCATYVFPMVRNPDLDTFLWVSDYQDAPECYCILDPSHLGTPRWRFSMSCGDPLGLGRGFYLNWDPPPGSPCNSATTVPIRNILIDCNPILGMASAQGPPTFNLCCLPADWALHPADPPCHTPRTSYIITISG